MNKALQAILGDKPYDLGKQIEAALIAVDGLRAETGDLREQVRRLEAENARLLTDNELLRNVVESERAERRHHHSLANELVTRLDVVRTTIDSIIRAAEKEAHRKRLAPTDEQQQELINATKFLESISLKEEPS
jgi:hypothetical protein